MGYKNRRTETAELCKVTIELKLGRHVAERVGYTNPRSAIRGEWVPMGRRPVGGGLDFALFQFFIFFSRKFAKVTIDRRRGK